jgi:Zn finger protein HypA/HybF involved in hydrogenase expression
MTQKATPISQAEYELAREQYDGWCHVCKDFTREETEPDAEEYDCPECGGNTVTGAENALIAGLIELA